MQTFLSEVWSIRFYIVNVSKYILSENKWTIVSSPKEVLHSINIISFLLLLFKTKNHWSRYIIYWYQKNECYCTCNLKQILKSELKLKDRCFFNISLSTIFSSCTNILHQLFWPFWVCESFKYSTFFNGDIIVTDFYWSSILHECTFNLFFSLLSKKY